MIGRLTSQPVALRDNRDYDAIARFHFLDIRNALLVARYRFWVFVVARGQDDDWEILVDQRVGAVLHFPRRITLRVNIRNFLELECTLERNGEMNAAPQVKEITVTVELAREIFVNAVFVASQN